MTKEQRRKFYNSKDWRLKRNEVLTKFNYECLWCKEEGKVTTNHDTILEVDHIEELEKRPDLALEDKNLRVLCKYHHNIRHDRFGHIKKKNKWNDERW